MRFCPEQFQDEGGQGLVEYGLVLVLIAAVIAIVFPNLTNAIQGLLQSAANAM